MKKLPVFHVALTVCAGISMAAESETIDCQLQSITRDFAVKPVKQKKPRWAYMRSEVPLTVELKLAASSEKTIIQDIAAGEISITDAKGNTLEWSVSEKDSIREQKDIAVFKIHTAPLGDWVEIKGSLSVQVSGNIVTHPAQSIKMGEKGKLNIPGREISYEWDEADVLELSMSGKDNRAIADYSFKTPAGEPVDVCYTAHSSGMGEVSRGYGFDDAVKAVSIILKTYGEPKSMTVPVNLRIGFSGELKVE